MKTRLYLLLAFALASLASCSHNDKDGSYTTKLTIASEQRDCVGVGLQRCYLVKQEGEKEWTYFYSSIDNFEYTPGYEYEIKVRVTPVRNAPMDASDLSYTLENVISSKEKESEGMLPDVRIDN